MHRCLAAIVLSISCTGQAAALDLPARKPGLWEITWIFNSTRRAPQVMQQCVDAATDELLQERFSIGQRSDCHHEVIRSGSMVVVKRCRGMRAIFEGDFDSAYTVTITSSDSPPSTADDNSWTVTQNARWLGPCTPSQKPGDADWVSP